MLTVLGMVLALSAAKWHCKPCASCKINPVPNFAALRHLWQYLIQQIDQLKARCSVAKLGPLRHKCPKDLKLSHATSVSFLRPCRTWGCWASGATLHHQPRRECQLSVQTAWICSFACVYREYWIILQFYRQLFYFVFTVTWIASLQSACKAVETRPRSPRRRLRESSGRDK